MNLKSCPGEKSDRGTIDYSIKYGDYFKKGHYEWLVGLLPELIADIIIFVQLGVMTLPVMFLLDYLCFAEQNISSTLPVVCNDVHDYATRKKSWRTLFINYHDYAKGFLLFTQPKFWLSKF